MIEEFKSKYKTPSIKRCFINFNLFKGPKRNLIRTLSNQVIMDKMVSLAKEIFKVVQISQ